MNKNLKSLSNQEVVEQYYIIKQELEDRNIEQSLPDYVSYEEIK